jgi:hypothetical protein
MMIAESPDIVMEILTDFATQKSNEEEASFT